MPLAPMTPVEPGFSRSVGSEMTFGAYPRLFLIDTFVLVASNVTKRKVGGVMPVPGSFVKHVLL